MPLSYTYDRKSWNQQIKLYVATPDDEAIVLNDTYDAGELPLNGSLCVGGNYFSENPSFIVLVASADESSNQFTFVGLDQSGRRYEYSFAGPDSTSLIIQIPFAQLLSGSIIMENDSSGDISVGISAQTATPWCPIDEQRIIDSLGFFVFLSEGSDINYTLQYTNDEVNAGQPPSNFIADQILVDQTITNSSGLNNPANACRVIINEGSTVGVLLFQLKQQGDFTSAPPSIRG